MLARYASRIDPHQTVAETILAEVCSDAAHESYRAAGRFGSTEAVTRLKLMAEGLPGGGAQQFIPAEPASRVGLIQVLGRAEGFPQMTYFSQYGFSSADVAGAVAEAAVHDLRVNGFSFNGFPQILVSTNAERQVFIVTLSWAEHSDCTATFEMSLNETKASVKRFKDKQGYDPVIFDRVQSCLASLEGKAGDAHRKAMMGAA